MANDIDKTSPHFKGEFGSIYEVNQKFPNGGVAGDYVEIDGWAHYWNADRGTWCVNAQRDSYWDELITGIINKLKLFKDATYMGVADVSTIPEKIAGVKMYYFAKAAGTYSGFGGLQLAQGINVLYTDNGTLWTATPLLEVAQELGVSTEKVMSQKAVNAALDKKFDKESVAQEFGDSENKVVSQSALPFRYIQNEEFIFAKVDAEGKLLSGILQDGTYWVAKAKWIDDIKAIKNTLQDYDYFKDYFHINLKESSISILGDSLSTFNGYTAIENVSYYPNDTNDVFSVNDTWWMRLISKTNARLEINNSWSGSKVSGNDISSYLNRVDNVGNPKYLIIHGGTNDSWGNVPVGSLHFSADISELNINEFADSYDLLVRRAISLYPNTNIILVIPHTVSDSYAAIINEIAKYYNLFGCVDLRQYVFNTVNGHYQVEGMKTVEEAIAKLLYTNKYVLAENGKSLINKDVAESFFYISNDEYIIAAVDAEGRILAGIKYGGEPYFPNHGMYSVVTNEEWLYAIIDAENKILGGFRANDGHMIVGGIDISTFISDAIIDIADIKERTAHLSTIDNDEYLSVETDTEGKVIGYIAPDGSHYLYKVKSETIPTEFSHIEDPEGRTEITTDADDKLLGYREKDGTRYEHKQKVGNLSVNHFSNLSETACQDIINSLSAYGLTLENKLDFSDNTDIFIPIPRGVAVVNIIADSLATSKTQNKDAILEFWGSGIYFRKNIILNAQGQTSMAFAKKNQSFDFKDGTSINFGDWVSQDSFHLKANADDVFCGLNNVVYKYADYVVGKTDTRANRVLRSATTSYQNASGKFNADFDDNAKCMPDGFPISLHLNGEFYGMYTWNMKKHRANYSMNKKDYTSIMIDPDRLTSETFWNGTIDWSKFELKNPKTLICMDGSKYDGDNPKELIDLTSEKYDESNKDMKNTAITKSLLVSLSNAMPAVNALSNNEEKKAKFKELFDYDNLVVYFLVSNAIGNYDGLWGRNTVFTIYNSGKCGFNFYDCNAVFGREASGWYNIKPDEIEKAAGTPFEMLDTLFHTEIANEYAKLRTGNLISTDTICTFLKDWLRTIGAYSISRNLDKWKDIPSYRDGSKTYPSYPTSHGFYDSFQRCEKWIKERISFMDNYFNYNV